MARAPFLRRSLEPVLARAAREFPVVVLTGPRQAGKTTLLQNLFGHNRSYASLDVPDVRAAALADPRGFLEQFGTPVILDKIQHAPELISYVKESVDLHRRQPGRFILTGSQNLLLTQRVTETLAGRAAILRLLPLSWRELLAAPQRRLMWERRAPNLRPAARPKRAGALRPWESFLRGGYPEPATHPRRDATLWHASYVQAYLERDVRSLRQVGDLTQFQSFVRALAARSAQLVNFTNLARDLGVAVNTIKAWLAVLEASHQISIVRPYSANLTKRLVKTPKVYFTDVGTLCYLVGLRDAEHAMRGPMAGAIFETAVHGEIVKALWARGVEPRVYFWRTSTGDEVDFLVEDEMGLVPIEAKASATLKPEMAAGIAAFRRDIGERGRPGYVVYAGRSTVPMGPNATGIPLWDL